MTLDALCFSFSLSPSLSLSQLLFYSGQHLSMFVEKREGKSEKEREKIGGENEMGLIEGIRNGNRLWKRNALFVRYFLLKTNRYVFTEGFFSLLIGLED